MCGHTRNFRRSTSDGHPMLPELVLFPTCCCVIMFLLFGCFRYSWCVTRLIRDGPRRDRTRRKPFRPKHPHHNHNLLIGRFKPRSPKAGEHTISFSPRFRCHSCCAKWTVVKFNAKSFIYAHTQITPRPSQQFPQCPLAHCHAHACQAIASEKSRRRGQVLLGLACGVATLIALQNPQ